MSENSDRLDARLKEAYEAMGPSDEAMARVWEKLEAAQNAKEAGQKSQAGAAAAEAGAPTGRKVITWQRVLPLAAALLAVAVLGGLFASAQLAPRAENSAPSAVEAAEERQDSAALEAPAAASGAEQDAEAPVSAESAYTVQQAPQDASTYSLIELADGSVLNLGELLAEDVRELDGAERALAWLPDRSDYVEVAAVKDEAGDGWRVLFASGELFSAHAI